VWSAQKRMPDLREGDVVFYCPTDTISDQDAIMEASCEKCEYKGGHALFACSTREKTIHDILYDLRPYRSA
jgi:hypothetical protein